MSVIAILDVDGTLIDSNYHHALAWYRAFRRFDYVVALARLHRLMGMGGDNLVGEVAGEEFDREHGEDVRAVEKEEYAELIGEVSPFEHARELIDALRDRGCEVVLSSSSKQKDIDHYIALLDVDGIAHTTSSDVESTKPDPDLIVAALEKVGGGGDAFLLGDSTWDCEAAERAGVSPFGVLTGGFSREELDEAGAERVYSTIGEVIDDLDALLDAATPTRVG